MPYLPRRRPGAGDGENQSEDAGADSAGGQDQSETLVYCWRFSQLWDAGYDSKVAEELALSESDLHKMVKAKKAGLSDERALEIFL